MPKLELGKRKSLRGATKPQRAQQETSQSKTVPWHTLAIDEVIKLADTDRKTGLSSDQIEKRLLIRLQNRSAEKLFSVRMRG